MMRSLKAKHSEQYHLVSVDYGYAMLGIRCCPMDNIIVLSESFLLSLDCHHSATLPQGVPRRIFC